MKDDIIECDNEMSGDIRRVVIKPRVNFGTFMDLDEADITNTPLTPSASNSNSLLSKVPKYMNRQPSSTATVAGSPPSQPFPSPPFPFSQNGVVAEKSYSQFNQVCKL